ncbi:C39 family peptidase [Spirosoma panaciterrae]|uniref:C39 family peptidase n=1 Tax=Spirosoma panaciterrae TaxID=496058 RepID=UPI0003694F89|nr:C39 family peptidase [Spirosoma panaciterrae]
MPIFDALSNAKDSNQQAKDALKTIVVKQVAVSNTTSVPNATSTYPKANFSKTLSLSNYQHWYEGNVPSGKNPSGVAYKNMKLNVNGCAPSAYIIAKALVAPGYKVTTEEYKKAIDGMGTDNTGTSMDKIGVYAKSQFGSSHYGLMTTTDREQAKKAIQIILDKNKPVIVNIRVSGTKIVEKGGVNHVIVVYGLKQTPNGGTVSYIDPLEKNANSAKKSIDYSTLLNSMKSSGEYYLQAIGLLS